MTIYHPEETSTDSQYDNHNLADLVSPPTTSIQQQPVTQFNSNSSSSNYSNPFSSSERSFKSSDSPRNPFYYRNIYQTVVPSPPPASSRSSNSRTKDFINEQEQFQFNNNNSHPLTYPPPTSYSPITSKHSNPHNAPSSSSSNTLRPPPHNNNNNQNAQNQDLLPHFSRYSPTWISGGYSLDGKAYTTHSPHFSPQTQAQGSSNWQIDPYYSSQDEFESGGGGRKEWDGRSGGDYRYGVGFDDSGGGKGAGGRNQAKKVEKERVDRLRRLEREFGTSVAVEEGGGKGGGGKILFNNMSLKERIEFSKSEKTREKLELQDRSGVDSKGRLIVSGPKKRSGLRWLQALGAIGVGFGSIGAAILTHPTSPAPPASKSPLYLLYLFPFLSLFITLYLFVFKPCSSRRKSKSILSSGIDPHNPFMIPLLNGGVSGGVNENSRGCCGGRKKSKKSAGGGGGQTINLMMDPRMFRHLNSVGAETKELSAQNLREKERKKRRKEKDRDRRRKERRRTAERKRDSTRGGGVEEYDSDSSSTSDTSTSSSKLSSEDAWSISDPSTSKKHQRKNLLSILVLESRWKLARRTLKIILIWDLIYGLGWSGVVIYSIGFGEKCKPGSFQGWCDFYNSALALSVITALAFLISVVLDILDLTRTSISPRLTQQRLSDFP